MSTRRTNIFFNYPIQGVLKRFVLLFLFYFVFISLTVSQPCSGTLNGTYTVGTNGDFPTLTSASVAYNNSCLAGPVVFILTDSLYSVAETYPIVFNRNLDANTTNTLTIKPQSGRNVNIIANVDNVPVIRIKGSYVTFDGSNNGSESQNLSLVNNAVNSPRLIYIQSNSSAPNVNICLKNMIMTNGNDRSVISIGDTLSTSGVLPGYFTDITIKNNQFRRSLYGIFATAKVQSGNGNRLLIEKNDLSATGSNAMRFNGIYLRGVEGATINNNIIGNFDGTDSATDKGIWLADSVRNTTVSNNKIFNLNYTGTKGNGAHGIYLSTGIPNASITIANNMIANLSGDGADYASGSKLIDNPTGIMIDNFPTNQSGVRLLHNSIFLGGIAGFTNTLNKFRSMSSCIRLKGGSVAEIRNNILVNNLGRKDSIGFGSVCIMTSNGNAQISGMDNNMYWISPTGSGIKQLGYHFSASNGYTTLSSWKAYTNKDQSSLSAFPEFISGNDLHLKRNANASINNKGLALIGWDIDFDGTQRNKTNPDIGCDEFMPNNLSNWIGKYSDVWTLDSNWEAGVISNDTTDLVLSGVHDFWPRITGNVSVRNLIIQSDPNVVALVGDTLSVLHLFGNCTSISGSINASKSTIHIRGTSPQFINPNVFWKNKVLNVIVSNPTDSGLILNGPLDVYRSLKFEGLGKKIQTNDFLCLKSDANETAWVEDLTGRSIVGKVSVERFISTGLYHGKSWQLLSVPVYGNQTINQAWQDSSNSPNQNRFPGYGTMLTGAQTNATSFGFDVATPAGGASIKQYSAQDSNFVSVSSTFLPIANTKGYLVLVRGDRSVTSFNGIPTPTILRTKGILYNHDAGNPAQTISVASNKFESIGNPLASALDFKKLSITGTIDSTFYVWDPFLPGQFNLGGFQTISSTNGYLPIPGGTVSYPDNVPVSRIESGQAFFVHGGQSGGLVGFPEVSKVNNSRITNRSNVLETRNKLVFIKLIQKIGISEKVLDGVSCGFFSDDIGNSIKTIPKLMANQNPFSIFHNNQPFATLIKNRTALSDSFQLRIKSLNVGNYVLDIHAINTELNDDYEYFLKDHYANTEMMLNSNSTDEYHFVIDANSFSNTEFRFSLLVRKKLTVLPVKEVVFEARANSDHVNDIRWLLKDAEGIRQVMLERSDDAKRFVPIHKIADSIQTKQNISGSFLDFEFEQNVSFYRLRWIDFDGQPYVGSIEKVERKQSGFKVDMVNVNGDKSKISFIAHCSRPGDLNVFVRDAASRLLLKEKIKVFKGKNSLHVIPNLHLTTGNYFIEFQLFNEKTVSSFSILPSF